MMYELQADSLNFRGLLLDMFIWKSLKYFKLRRHKRNHIYASTISLAEVVCIVIRNVRFKLEPQHSPGVTSGKLLIPFQFASHLKNGDDHSPILVVWGGQRIKREVPRSSAR